MAVLATVCGHYSLLIIVMKFWVIWTVSNWGSEEIFSLIVVLFTLVLASPVNGHLTWITICVSIIHWTFTGENNVWNKRWG